MVDWAVIRNPADASAFVAGMTSAPRAYVGRPPSARRSISPLRYSPRAPLRPTGG